MMLGAKRAVLVSLRNIFQISLYTAGDEPQPYKGGFPAFAISNEL